MVENICEFCGMTFKHKSFIHKIGLIDTRATPLKDHLQKFYLRKAFLFIHKNFQLYDMTCLTSSTGHTAHHY